MDWKKLISELLESGMTQTSIGEHIGVTQGAISQVLSERARSRRGFKWETGQKLIALHKTRTSAAKEPAAA